MRSYLSRENITAEKNLQNKSNELSRVLTWLRKKFLYVEVKKRYAITIEAVLRNWAKSNGILYTDKWRAYRPVVEILT